MSKALDYIKPETLAWLKTQSPEQLALLQKTVKNYDETFRWEQYYYHRNRLDSGTSITPKRFNKFINGVKVYFTEDEQRREVAKYIDSLAPKAQLTKEGKGE